NTGSRPADDAETRRGGEKVSRHLGGASDQERVGLFEIPRKIRWATAGSGVDVPPFGTQKLLSRRWKVVGDHYVHKGVEVTGRPTGRRQQPSIRPDRRFSGSSLWCSAFGCS